MPDRYRGALLFSRSETVKSLHYSFTLLLARNLNIFEGEETIFRVKEILTMMWVSSDWSRSGGATIDRVGMESFFDSNKSTVMGWIYNGQGITYIHEILHHLRIAQAKEPRIGSLWRVTPHQEDNKSILWSVFYMFGNLIHQGVTPEQHYEIIDLVCQDLALGPQEALKAHFRTRFIEIHDYVEDPCLLILFQSCAEAVGDSFYPSLGDIDSPLKDSWARIATYFMTRSREVNSPFFLTMQRSLWPVFPNRSQLCSRALQDPELLTHLQHIFEHRVACQQHRDIEGHLLLHIFEGFQGIIVSANMTAFTRIPITGRSIHVLLSMMILPDTQYGRHSENLRLYIHEQCLARVLEIGRGLRASQYHMLTFLCHLPEQLIARDADGRTLCSEELAGMSVCVIRALDLPSDPRVALIIPDLVSGIRKMKEKMYSRNWRSDWENQTADKEATIASDRLMTHLVCMKIVGGQNLRTLFCSRTQGSHSPAIGWLAMHTD